MAPLTEEQRERIRINRERAAEIRRRKMEEKLKQEKEEEEEEEQKLSSVVGASSTGDSTNGKRKADNGDAAASSTTTTTTTKKSKSSVEDKLPSFLDDGLPIEPFEEGASEYVTKKEAMASYCLPEGTLAVLTVEERDNPHNKLWKPMKLYRRREVRSFAHKRWGNLSNLQKERQRRQQRKLEKDMKDADDIFK